LINLKIPPDWGVGPVVEGLVAGDEAGADVEGAGALEVTGAADDGGALDTGGLLAGAAEGVGVALGEPQATRIELTTTRIARSRKYRFFNSFSFFEIAGRIRCPHEPKYNKV
jgi:hypothetical protein